MLFLRRLVLWRGGGVAVAMAGYRSGNRCSGRTVGQPNLLIGEAACRAVLVRPRAVAATDTGPVIEVLDLLVLHDAAH